jgi:MerR family redox-sensitive transcriptional activator SoxR
MAEMSIGEVARKMGLRSSAIRYYERLGLIPKAPRLSGRRRYDERVLERLAMVRFAKHVGFSIAEIKVLLRGVDGRPPPERWRKLAAEKVAQVDAFVRRNLAVADDDHIQASVVRLSAARARPPRKPSRVMQCLRSTVRHVDEARVCRAQVAGEFV